MIFTTADEILAEYAKEEAGKEEIKKAIEDLKNCTKDDKKDEKYITMPHNYNTIIPPLVCFYQVPRRNEEYFFTYTPAGVSIIRVPQAQLGFGVLGVAYLGKGLIKIADHLHGQDFEEVKKHEVNHMLYPSLTEHEIRLKTRNELPFETRYH